MPEDTQLGKGGPGLELRLSALYQSFIHEGEVVEGKDSCLLSIGRVTSASFYVEKNGAEEHVNASYK